MICDIEAVAFDIDGTLYPDWRLFIRIAPYFFKNLSFFLTFKKVRYLLHRTAPLPDFFEYQARLLAAYMEISPEQAHELIREKIYDGLVRFFPHVKPFKHMRSTLQSFKEAGLKLAVLSDFPPEQKGDMWGCKPFFDCILGSEECGALKPSAYPFGILRQSLNVSAERILYVGNSIRSDIQGAHNAGMKTAYLIPFWRRILHKKPREADICFKNYRQLCKIVLQLK
ncbi:HAD family hydrolase [Treponema sp. OMZ 840]|uniref:HAD family hydrolase n=1 Tax=Treponema sp. OMZ 840 TaxID=244313 RepID=UPI003D8DC8D5